MKLTDILNGSCNPQEWEAKGYELPKYDIKAVAAKTYEEPTWVQFGAGNIFRAFTAGKGNGMRFLHHKTHHDQSQQQNCRA